MISVDGGVVIVIDEVSGTVISADGGGTIVIDEVAAVDEEVAVDEEAAVDEGVGCVVSSSSSEDEGGKMM